MNDLTVGTVSDNKNGSTIPSLNGSLPHSQIHPPVLMVGGVTLVAMLDQNRSHAFLEELKRRGVSVLLVEQKLTIAMSVSDRACVMGHGSIVFEGTPDELRANAYIRKEWLEV